MLFRSGHELGGIRLDSGDLAYLSKQARRMLDEAGFPKAQIVASNDLDPDTIASLREEGARIDVWGVGTRLVTAYDEPALGGVYKLAAVRPPERTRARTPAMSWPPSSSGPGSNSERRRAPG